MATKAAAVETMRAQTVLTWLACLALIGGLLYAAKAVLVPLALAVLLTFLLAPAVIRLQRIGLPKIVAVITVVVLAFALIGAIGWLVSSQIVALAQELPKHQPRVEQKVTDLKRSFGGGGVFDNVLRLFEGIRERLEEETPEEHAAERLKRGAEPEPLPVRVEPEEATLPETFNSLVSPLVEPLATAGLVVVLVIFILLTREDLRNRIVTLSGQSHLAVTTKALDEAGKRIARYLLMQFVINVTYGLTVAAGLFLIGVPYAPLWGIAAAVLRYIPYVGPWVAAILPLGYSALTSSGWWQPVSVIGLILVLELVSNNIIEPLLYGRGIGVSSVAVILAAVFWGWLWGPVGLVLATPLTVCLVVAGRYVPALTVFNRLLGEAPEVEPHFVYYQRLLAKDDDEAEELFDDHAKQDGLAVACEAVLVPAIVLANRDRLRGLIEPEQLSFILECAVEHLEEVPEESRKIADRDRTAVLAAREVPGQRAAPAPQAVPDQSAEPRIVFGYGSRDPSDEAALAVMRRLLDHDPVCRFVPLSRAMLLSEVVDRILSEQPAGLCLLSLPPGGLAHARTLCKRLKAAAPDLKIAVGRWGATLPEKYRASLRGAGASYVGRTPAETVDHLISMTRLRTAEKMSNPAADRDDLPTVTLAAREPR